MKKKDEVANPKSCLNKAGVDEPLFVIRAKDPEAPDTVRTWANNARTRGTHEPEKIDAAFALAAEMAEWREKNGPAEKKAKGGKA